MTYHQPVPLLWWTRRRSYVVFVLRELSSVAVAWFVVHFLLLVTAVHRGPGAYQEFLDWSARPLILVVNLVALAFVVLHAVTWFNLAPKALVVRVQGQQVPPRMIAAGHFGAWFVVSAIVAWVLVVML
ncbi:fumarate reductase [Pseudonocardia sp. CNS-004]|nr:fumarate reductase [Pseudonocardia sp. CNS-004]